MIVYLFSFLFLVVSVLYSLFFESEYSSVHDPYYSIGNKYTKHLFLFNIIIFMLITGLRDMIGGSDVYIYGVFFEEVPSLISIWNGENYLSSHIYNYFEKGYLFYNSFLKIFIDDKYLFFLFTAILCYTILFKVFFQYNNSLIILLLFISKFLLVGFSYNRQFMAMCFVWLAIYYCHKGCNWRFLFFILIASSLHVSALIALPIIFIRKRRFKISFLAFIFILSLLIGVTPLINYLQFFLGKVLAIDKIALGYSNTGTTTFHVFYFLESSFIVFCIFKYRELFYSSSKSILIFNVCVVYVCLSLMTLKSSGIIRFMWYYNIGFLVLFPRFCFLLFKNRFLVFLIISIYMSSVFFRGLILRDDGDYMPYKVFFLDEPKRMDIYQIKNI